MIPSTCFPNYPTIQHRVAISVEEDHSPSSLGVECDGGRNKNRECTESQ